MPWGNPAMPTADVRGPSSCVSGKVFFMGLQCHTRHEHEILKGRLAILSAISAWRSDSASCAPDCPPCGRRRMIRMPL